MSEKTSSPADNSVAVRLEPKKIFLKDVSFESPLAPKVFMQGDFKPEIDVQMLLHHTQLDTSHYEVVLEVTATAKTGDDVVFLAEVLQAGIFDIVAQGPEQLEMLKEIACPNVLLPFAREEIAALITKGGFPQLLLNPVNFEALYAQKKQKEARSQATPSSEAIN